MNDLRKQALTTTVAHSPKVGIDVDFADPCEPLAFAAALRTAPRMFYRETPGNPLMLLTHHRGT